MLLKDTVFFLPPPTFCTEGSWKRTQPRMFKGHDIIKEMMSHILGSNGARR